MRELTNFEKPDMAYRFLDECKKVGLDVFFTCVDRSYITQTALFAQGREPLDFVNDLRKKAGLPRISHDENRRKVTWTMNSKHIVNLDDERLDNDKSEALDFCILNPKTGKVSWDVKADVNTDNQADYQQCGEIAEGLGFKWGGRFKNPDMPHIELP